MVEEVGDGVAVVGIVPLEGGLQIPVDVLALDEQQRQAVHEAHDVGPAPVEAAAHPQLPHAEEVIVGGLVEVEDPQALVHQIAVGVLRNVTRTPSRISACFSRLAAAMPCEAAEWTVVAAICRTASSYAASGRPGFRVASLSRSGRVRTTSRSEARPSRLSGP